MARGTGAGTQREEVSTASGTTSIYPKAEWPRAQAFGHSLDPRSDGADGSGGGPRTNLRGGSATRATRVSAGAQRAHRGQPGASPAEHGSRAGHRRGFSRVL